MDTLTKNNSDLRKLTEKLYGYDGTRRVYRVIDLFKNSFGGEPHVFSAPGRVEIIGNHTDHNNGLVLTSSVNFDALAAASSNGTNRVRLISEGFEGVFEVDLTDLNPKDGEKYSTNALIRGVASYFAEHGYNTGGFDAYVISDVPKGSGLSSSASFEVLVACIFSELFNSGGVKPEFMAIAGRYAENVFFGKPCGLMDQMASAYGGIISIDFKDSDNPVIKRTDIDFGQSGYIPVYVKTGDSHADLTHEYAAITDEMGMISGYFGSRKSGFVREDDFYAAMPELVEKMPGRAILRAMHYFDENKRVSDAVKYLASRDIGGFLRCVNESGTSSWQLLQNCYAGSEQRTTVALALAKRILRNDGAVRVHGGGFGGGILLFVPAARLDEVKAEMDHVLGAGSSSALYLRPVGALKLL